MCPLANWRFVTRYLHIAGLYEELGRTDKASGCAERAEEIDRDCLGVDHEGYLSTRDTAGRLRAVVRDTETL